MCLSLPARLRPADNFQPASQPPLVPAPAITSSRGPTISSRPLCWCNPQSVSPSLPWCMVQVFVRQCDVRRAVVGQRGDGHPLRSVHRREHSAQGEAAVVVGAGGGRERPRCLLGYNSDSLLPVSLSYYHSDVLLLPVSRNHVPTYLLSCYLCLSSSCASDLSVCHQGSYAGPTGGLRHSAGYEVRYGVFIIKDVR